MRRVKKVGVVVQVQEPETEQPQETVSAKAQNVPQLPVGWGNVVTDSLDIKDPPGTAKRLREELSLGDERTSYGAVLQALDRSARNLDDAGRLHRAAKLEEESYAAKVAARLEVLRSSAQAELMEEYHRKERRSPTNDDVEARIVANWPDEYGAINERKARIHAAVATLETLRDAWASRCADLRVMADKARPVS